VNYYIELLNSIKRGVISPVYLFYGEETYLQEQAVLRFKEFAVGGQSELNCEVVDGETATPAQIVESAETLPLFSERRLVVVKNPVFFKSAKRGGQKEDAEEGAKEDVQEKPLIDYIENPLVSTCLIFTVTGPVDKRRRIFKAVKECGRELEFTCLSREELAGWLAKRARAEGRRFAPGAEYALVDAAGPLLQNLAVELEKLLNYSRGRETITKKDIFQVCPPKPEENVFAVVDAVGNRRCGEALAGIKDMLAAREPPLKILSMIARQFRLLLQVHDMTEKGFSERDVAAGINMKPYAVRKLMAQCRNFSRLQLLDALKYLSETDFALKTGRQEFYPAVEVLLLRLCAGRGKRVEDHDVSRRWT